LDARTGKLLLERDWGTRLHSTEVQVTEGGVLVKTGPGGIMRSYSPDFGQARDLPVAQDPKGDYVTSVSASGRSIAVSHYFEKDHNRHIFVSRIDVLDASSLKVRFSWDQYPPYFHLSMSDESFATEHNGVVALRDFGSADRSKVLAAAQGELKEGCPAGSTGPKVVSDEAIVLRDCKEVLLLTTAGQSYSLDPFNGYGSTAPEGPCRPYNSKVFAKVAVASDGARIVALTLPSIKVKKPLLAEARTCLDGLEVAVYDLVLKKRILRLDVDSLPKRNYELALSPDGSSLAVLNDRNVSVYSVSVR